MKISFKVSVCIYLIDKLYEYKDEKMYKNSDAFYKLIIKSTNLRIIIFLKLHAVRNS